MRLVSAPWTARLRILSDRLPGSRGGELSYWPTVTLFRRFRKDPGYDRDGPRGLPQELSVDVIVTSLPLCSLSNS